MQQFCFLNICVILVSFYVNYFIPSIFAAHVITLFAVSIFAAVDSQVRQVEKRLKESSFVVVVDSVRVTCSGAVVRFVGW